jgi:hypothetical protein
MLNFLSNSIAIWSVRNYSQLLILIVDSILFVPCKVSVLFLMLCAALFFKGHVYDGKVKPLPGFLTLSHKS